MPVLAVTKGGIVNVLRGSIIPIVGLTQGIDIPILIFCASKSIIITVVPSEPVPAVVGTPISGLNGPGTFIPLPTGGLI